MESTAPSHFVVPEAPVYRHIAMQLVFNRTDRMALDTLSLAGKTAIVTGSERGNGIGEHIPHALACNGTAVTIIYVSDSPALRPQDVSESIGAAGGRGTAVQVDVSNPRDAKSVIDKTLEAFGVETFDILGERSFSLV